MKNKKQMFVGEVKVSYKRLVEVNNDKFMCSSDGNKFFRQLIDEDIIEHHEEFWIAYLNRQNNLIGFQQLGIGTLTATIIDIRHLMQSVLGCNCNAIILMHNHPSGNLKPSDADDNLTKRIQDACNIFDIKVLDHLILTHDNYFSYADEGRL